MTLSGLLCFKEKLIHVISAMKVDNLGMVMLIMWREGGRERERERERERKREREREREREIDGTSIEGFL